MAKTATKLTGTKWYLNKGARGYEPGIYYSSEVREMPLKIRSKYIQSLSSAHSEGLIDPDLRSGSHLNDLDLYAPVETDGTQPKLKGVKDGLAPGSSIPKQEDKPAKPTKASQRKIKNALRDSLKESAKYSTEDSLKAKILAAKAKRK